VNGSEQLFIVRQEGNLRAGINGSGHVLVKRVNSAFPSSGAQSKGAENARARSGAANVFLPLN
jgi:hypothetical protein